MPRPHDQVTRTYRMIRAGYFPAELPPPFTTNSLAKRTNELLGLWSADQIRRFWSAPERFSIPRYSQVRRNLSIVNPINQLLVTDIISENWDEIKTRISRSRISEFKPSISATGRSIKGVDFDAVKRRQAEILAKYGRYIRTDIARFYPSVYTHSIAWAIAGKQWCKDNHKSSAFKSSFGNSLDKAVAAGQSGQTIGIPIGPDTSRVISELIASELEELTRTQITDLDERGVRYVDDMIIGLADTETADTILSKLSSALYEYELELNGEKTQIQGLGLQHAPEWIHFVRSFELSTKAGRQRDEIDAFFEQVIFLADQNLRDNVYLFGAKRAASFLLTKKNYNHVVRWLLYLGRRSTATIPFIVQHYAVEKASGQELPENEISEFIHQQLPLRAEAAHTAEVAWLIFWARELRLRIEAGALDRVLKLRSSVCALLIFDLLEQGLVNGTIRPTLWTSFANKEGLKSEMWLVAYEATKKDWWPRTRSDKYIRDHEFFGDLLSRNVSFYERRRKSRPQLGKAKSEMLQQIGIEFDDTYP